MNIYAIYDIKAEAYLKPFFCTNHAVAIRAFATAAGEGEFFRHPEDYYLFAIGTYDERTGNIENTVNYGLGSALDIHNTQTNIVADLRSAKENNNE